MYLLAKGLFGRSTRPARKEGTALPSACGHTCLLVSHMSHLFHEMDHLNYYMRVTFFENFETCRNLLNTLKFIGFREQEMDRR